MSFFSYDYYKNLKRAEFYLGYPDKRNIGAIHANAPQTDIFANSVNTLAFTIYRYTDEEPTKFYDDVVIGKYVHSYGVGWFRIKEVTVVNEGKNEYKEISALSIECELGETYLTSFGSLGTDNDEQGGLDRYCLYNKLDTSHSILHIFLEKNPGWRIDYVDPNISTEYRSFEVDIVDSYSFLTDTVASAYECVFIFNNYTRSVSTFKLSNLGIDTGITLNYRNVIKNIKMDSDEDDVKTVLTVVGGNDERTNTPLGIIDVNISGANQIYNFSYYLPMMSAELQSGLAHYEFLCRSNEAAYQEKISSLLSHYDELNTLRNKIPDEGESSTNWSLFGLRELQEKSLIYWDKMKTLLDSESDLYKQYNAIRQAIEAEIAVRENQISVKESEINTLTSEIQSLVVNLPDVLGEKLYAELNPFIREDTLTDESFIATNSMSDREILEMQQSLLEHGRTELERVCYPQFTMEIDLINFTTNYEYKRFTDALEMFNIIHINFEDHDSIISARLLKMHIDWDNPSNFSVTFSNRNTLKESWALIEEVKKQAEDVSSKVDFSTGAWKNAATVALDVNKYMNNILNAANQQLVSNDNNEVTFNKVGIQCRKWIPEKSIYDPAQIWITNNVIAITMDNWNTVGLAIGHVKMGNDYFFGVCADSVVGRLLLSNQLIVTNESGSYTIDKNGFIAKKDSYQVRINPDTPAEIFSISIDNKKLLYVDTSAKALTFEGKLISKTGQIANFNISENTLISGNMGLSSDKTSGAIAYWAGNTDRNNAPFRVSNTGALVCSNATITGGSLNVGEHFRVTTNGILTAKDANISGSVTAISGKIGGWTIDGNTLRGSKGSSYIVGGEINIGSGFFRVRDEEINIGDFIMTFTSRGLFMSEDQYSGISAHTSSTKMAIWAAYNGNGSSDIDNYGFAVMGSGDLYAKEIYVHGNSWWAGWSLTKTLKQVYGRIEDLENAISNLE